MSTVATARRRPSLWLPTLIAAVLSGCGAGATTHPATPTDALARVTPTPAATAIPSSTPVPTTPTPSPVPTPGWVGHSSRSGQLSFSYDSAWNLAECDPGAHYSWGVYSGTATTIFLGVASQQGFGECPLEDESPQIVLNSVPGTPAHNTPGPYPCDGTVKISSTTVVVDRVTGLRQETTYSGTYRCMGIPPIRDVSYVFGAHGRAYAFDYTYRHGDLRDLTGEFDRMIQVTLRFAAA
jgi:hypothetical protein